MSHRSAYEVKPGQALDLDAIDASHQTDYKKGAVADEVRASALRLRELQYLLYAEGRRGLLICLQAMDTGGKDGVIRHVLGFMNPQGCRVKSFRVPTAEEAAHDFLWRIHRESPARGEVVIFNRSHYEDVLVPKVYGLISGAQCLERYENINAFENLLTQSGVHILKFFLHISRDEQLERLNKRLKDPSRHWKVKEADYTDRMRWDDYMRAYQDALTHCSSEAAPWFIVPSDQKWFRNLVVSRIVVEYLEQLNMRYPAPVVDIEAMAARLRGKQPS